MAQANNPVALWRRVIARWPADWRFEWEERAAIVEYLGNVERDEAERQAYEIVAKRWAPK